MDKTHSTNDRMKLFSLEDKIKNSHSGCIATVGFFDGVHGGHRFLINEVIAEAKKTGMPAVVITFDEHPRKVLKSDFQPKLLTTFEEKIELLKTTQIDECVVLNFSYELSLLSAKEFITTVLKEKINVKTLFVGHDHRFGHNREEGFEDYKAYGDEIGIKVVQAQRYSLPNEENFSSSRIRKCLDSGEIEEANRLLTYPYTFMGQVINGYKNGRKIGFPTANIWFESDEKIIPKVGVYAVKVYLKGEEYKGMMNIGFRPTFHSDNSLSMEVHIIDFDDDIYDDKIKVECLYRIRDEKKFNGVDELIAQLKKDKELVRKLL